MARKHTISRKCLVLYTCKTNRKLGSTVYLLIKNKLESFEWKNKSFKFSTT